MYAAIDKFMFVEDVSLVPSIPLQSLCLLFRLSLSPEGRDLMKTFPLGLMFQSLSLCAVSSCGSLSSHLLQQEEASLMMSEQDTDF